MVMKAKRAKTKLHSNTIKENLLQIKMGQQELADLCDTNKGHISKIINGARGASISLPLAYKMHAAINKRRKEMKLQPISIEILFVPLNDEKSL